jgi:anthranilate synthase component 1
MYSPSEKEFLELSQKGNLIPVYREVSGDLDTPVSAYYKIAAHSRYSFLLESVEGEEKVARFSFLARDPEMILKTKGKKATFINFSKGRFSKKEIPIKGTPLDLIRDVLKKYQFVQVPGLPRFCGGMVGFLSYDTVRFFERLPTKAKDDLKLPETVLVLASELVIFDHLNHKIKVLKCVSIDPKASKTEKSKRYQAALSAIDKLVAELKKPLSLPKNINRRKGKQPIKLEIRSNLTQAEFQGIVEKAKKEIFAGEIIQVVLSQRFEVGLKTEPMNIYRALRSLNPSPYMYYLNFDDVKIIGASPELLVRCEDGIVDTRPIAGTRRRGKDAAEDESLAKDLLHDPKERAEHIMLVDLGRNDLGRVCKRGSVHLSEFMKIEKYSHVMHIVSNVKGELADDKDDLDVLQAAFPAGTVSGAPKIRAMEIIEDLEKVTRGPYAGCIGYFSFSGNLDTCITIRTIVVKNGKAYLQAGAGIVADSDPEKEYAETVNKAKAQLKAIELAHQT